MPKKISRRKFIGAAVLSGLAVYIGGYWFLKVRGKRAADIIAAILNKKLGYLQIEKAGVESFIADFQKTLSPKQILIGKYAGLFKPFYTYLNIFEYLSFTKKFKQFEEYVCTIFLLSSDFFYSGADVERVVKYSSLYDPYEAGCDNPFADF